MRVSRDRIRQTAVPNAAPPFKVRPTFRPDPRHAPIATPHVAWPGAVVSFPCDARHWTRIATYLEQVEDVLASRMIAAERQARRRPKR